MRIEGDRKWSTKDAPWRWWWQMKTHLRIIFHNNYIEHRIIIWSCDLKKKYLYYVIPMVFLIIIFIKMQLNSENFGNNYVITRGIYFTMTILEIRFPRFRILTGGLFEILVLWKPSNNKILPMTLPNIIDNDYIIILSFSKFTKCYINIMFLKNKKCLKLKNIKTCRRHKLTICIFYWHLVLLKYYIVNNDYVFLDVNGYEI